MKKLCIVFVFAAVFAACGRNAPEAGDVISFGAHYWLVLSAGDGYALIITEGVTGFAPYHASGEAVTWENSDIRAYLNGDFYNGFSEAERARIRETYLPNSDNPWFGTHGGENTTDKIFLLSLEETIRYFGGKLERDANTLVIDDEYNAARIARSAIGSRSWWWLRSPGGNNRLAVRLYGGGSIGVQGRLVGTVSGGVRPALRITTR